MRKASFDMAEVRKIKIKMIVYFTVLFTLTVIILSVLILTRTNKIWREKVLQLETALNKECNKNLNTLITQVQDSSTYIETLTAGLNKNILEGNYTTEEKERNLDQITDLLSHFSVIRAYDDLAIIYDDESFSGRMNSIINVDRLTLYKRLDDALKNNKEINWISGFNEDFEKIYYSKRIFENAIFMCSLNSSKIEEFLISNKSMNELKSIKTILINKKNQIIYSPVAEDKGKTIPEEAIEKILNGKHINEGNYYTLSICSNGWKIINSVELTELLSERRFTITYVIILGAISISVILLLCIILSLQFTIPLENLISTLHFQATRDNSTRFYNENSFTELCTDKLSETPEGSKQALFFVDIDHYNYLLEYLGHDECEKIIVDVADSLRHVFPKTTLFSRISADRMILLTEISKEEKLDDVITNYCVDFQQQLFARFQEEYDVTASIGISVYPDQEKRYPLLLKFAEKSMNIVKKNGRNGFHIFDPENDLKDK